MLKRNILFSIPLLATIGIVSSSLHHTACAGPNDFFGTAVPAGSASDASAGQQTEQNPYAETPMPEGDFSEDERRMQKKFKTRVKHAKSLIEKGKKLIETGEKKNKKKLISRGKIFVDIGERELKQLAENNPLSNLLTPQQKIDVEEKNKKTAQAEDDQ